MIRRTRLQVYGWLTHLVNKDTPKSMLACVAQDLNIQHEFHDLIIGCSRIHDYGQKGPEGTRLSPGYLTMLKRYVYERADGGLEPSVTGFAVPNSQCISPAGEPGWFRHLAGTLCEVSNPLIIGGAGSVLTAAQADGCRSIPESQQEDVFLPSFPIIFFADVRRSPSGWTHFVADRAETVLVPH